MKRRGILFYFVSVVVTVVNGQPSARSARIQDAVSLLLNGYRNERGELVLHPTEIQSAPSGDEVEYYLRMVKLSHVMALSKDISRQVKDQEERVRIFYEGI